MANHDPINTATPVTVITGGSDGIGKALADLFAERGDQLLLVARNEDHLRTAATELENRWGREVHIASFDLMEPDAPENLIQAIHERRLYVEYLVNSAGIGSIGSFTKSDLSEINALIQLNLSTTTALTHICLPDMIARNKGGVLNIASLAGLLPMPKLAVYSASKSYLIAFSRALSEELRHSAVNISVLIPGPVDTKFLSYSSDPAAKLQKMIPMLTPESVARVGFDGFLAKETTITPGLLNAFYRFGIKILPHRFLVRTLSTLYGWTLDSDQKDI